jgi:hypothetical protein
MPFNKRRLVGNSGLAFFTSLGGLFAGTGVIGLSLPPQSVFVAALFAAVIQAGIAFFREMASDP